MYYVPAASALAGHSVLRLELARGGRSKRPYRQRMAGLRVLSSDSLLVSASDDDYDDLVAGRRLIDKIGGAAELCRPTRAPPESALAGQRARGRSRPSNLRHKSAAATPADGVSSPCHTPSSAAPTPHKPKPSPKPNPMTQSSALLRPKAAAASPSAPLPPHVAPSKLATISWNANAARLSGGAVLLAMPRFGRGVSSVGQSLQADRCQRRPLAQLSRFPNHAHLPMCPS